MVLCDRLIENYHFPFVGTRHREAILQLVTHLRQEGFAKVALFTQEYTNISTRFIRRAAFLEGVAKDFPQEDGPSLIYKMELTDLEATKRSILELLATCRPGEVPAIFAVNSMCCTHLCQAIDELGLTIPGDLGLCAPDDWGWDSQFSISPLGKSNITSFSVQPAQVGSLAAQTLLQLIADPTADREDILLPADLTIRRSTQLRSCREQSR